MVDRMTIKQAITAIKNETVRSFAIVTDGFGVVDITKKEALRMVDTCEKDTIVISLSPGNPGMFILEYPE